ncbi:MAG: hypothetical protein ACD_69C00271G0003 [uncultured bacterium]|nr:MAG: hypothetical protein ACD_69C00271G0003 [uncultured bacterium]
MVLDQLLKISQRGADLPLEYWLIDFKTETTHIIPKLTTTAESLPNGKLRTLLSNFIKVLGQSEPNEQVLAEQLFAIATLFTTKADSEDIIIKNYQETCLAFLDRVKLIQRYAQKRVALHEQLAHPEQQLHDLKLFELEGMMYTLEYYLAQYKKIYTLSTTTERYKYIVQSEVDLGFGNVPGLQNDFKKYEVLEKFILNILNDATRIRLTKVYFFARIRFIQLTAEEEKMSATLTEFKQLIVQLIEEFKRLNITRLTGTVNMPYGQQPLIGEVLQQL